MRKGIFTRNMIIIDETIRSPCLHVPNINNLWLRVMENILIQTFLVSAVCP